MTINQALITATKKLQKNKIPTPRLNAEILLSHILKKPREYILAHPEKQLAKTQISNFKFQITKRAKGKPIAYITGHKQFYGLNFYINKNVLIPRPETEMIIDEILRITHNIKRITLIDAGTGSGCIIISIAKNLKSKFPPAIFCGIQFLATDISKSALTIARKNAKLHNVDKKISFLQGNLLEPILNNPKYIKHPNNPIIITANLPYLTPTQIKNSPSIQCEPKIALSAGADGLKYYRQLFKQIKKLNALYAIRYAPMCESGSRHPAGIVGALCEIDPRQTIMLKKIIKKNLPCAKIQIKKDLRGLNRLVLIKITNDNK